ncbi:MAG: single-stranded-DNA-specific exonuclease RecJ [Verrucomicrobiales bacterium]|jgi:single-stranded-DNA-specific exonuclease|nr:single-stranded-DNA-specific exonuclease RecJ [Verrucomicrobiales bacterium]
MTRAKRWELTTEPPVDPDSPPDIIERLLLKRGFSDLTERERFLHPRLQDLADPLRLPDMAKAVQRVSRALQLREPILIYSDYDVDGMSSSALLYRFLVKLGATVSVFIPERLSDGYGLSVGGLQRALAAAPASLVIALDCGTTNAGEVRWLNERGIEVIIIDHHELHEALPAACAFVNPQRGAHDHILSTAGLVFKFCHAFLKMLQDPSLFNLREHLDFVALGTVADLVPLLEDNRILVRHGLTQLAGTPHIGLQALMEVARVRVEPTPATVGFVLGPRLNASGRLAEATAGWELLTTHDTARATDLARNLNVLNNERQRLELAAYQEALDLIEKQSPEDQAYCLVVAADNWHQGVVGIVASRLQRRFYKPAVVIALNESSGGRGSARCIEGCSIMDALRDNAGLLKAYGGHAMASGLEIAADRVAEFRLAMNQWFQRSVAAAVYQERIRIDLALPGRALTEALAREAMRLQPFGRKNEPPIFRVSQVQLAGQLRTFGQRHIKFNGVADGVRFSAVGFGLAENIPAAASLDLAGHWEMDDFTGRPVFRIIDWRAAQD